MNIHLLVVQPCPEKVQEVWAGGRAHLECWGGSKGQGHRRQDTQKEPWAG